MSDPVSRETPPIQDDPLERWMRAMQERFDRLERGMLDLGQRIPEPKPAATPEPAAAPEKEQDIEQPKPKPRHWLKRKL